MKSIFTSLAVAVVLCSVTAPAQTPSAVLDNTYNSLLVKSPTFRNAVKEIMAHDVSFVLLEGRLPARQLGITRVHEGTQDITVLVDISKARSVQAQLSLLIAHEIKHVRDFAIDRDGMVERVNREQAAHYGHDFQQAEREANAFADQVWFELSIAGDKEVLAKQIVKH